MMCPWCSSESIPEGKYVDYETIVNRLFRLYKECDVVRISGGEPTMHPDIGSIVDYCKLLYKEIILLTNGSTYFYHSAITKYHISYNKYSERYVSFLIEQGVSRSNIMITAVLCPDSDVSGAMILSKEYKIPCHLYKLQQQGRARDMVNEIEVTCENGCTRNNKITITYDGKEIKCSADKEGEKCHGRKC